MNAYEKQAALVKVMGHPARLLILEILSQEEACVCHLAAILGQRQPYVSQHLMALRRAGLVLDRKDGALVYYRLAHERIAQVIGQSRALLQGMDPSATFTPLPRPPIAGCTCPVCTGEVSCAWHAA